MRLKYEYLIFFILIIVTWLICILCCFNLKTSKFNHYDKTYEAYLMKTFNLEKSSINARIKMESWLIKQNKTILFNNNNNTSFICIAILSKNRINSKINYINQAVMSLLTRVNINKYENNVSIMLFNTETISIMNTNALKLKNLINIENLSSNIINSNLRVKEAADYALALRKLNSKNCKYQLLLEDDAIAAFNWMERILKIIDELLLIHRNNWFIVKLFTGYKFYDWDWIHSKEIIRNLFIISLFLTCLTCFIYYNLLIRKSINFKLKSIRLVLMLINSIGITVFFNATSITPFHNGIREYSTGFGGVSVLFNGLLSIEYALYLEKTVNDYQTGKRSDFMPKDLLFQEFKELNNLTEFIVEPAVFQHTGLYSSLYDRDTSINGFKQMFKSYSFIDNHKLIEFLI
jgi:hypothetical protein